MGALAAHAVDQPADFFVGVAAEAFESLWVGEERDTGGEGAPGLEIAGDG